MRKKFGIEGPGSPIMASLFATLIAATTWMSPSFAAAPDWSQVAQALGKTGTELPGGIYRVGLPRSDLHVTLDGIAIQPALALGSWLAFRPMNDRTIVMGDLVLTEDELGPVMAKLAAHGIEITALHNHLLRAQPAPFYLHVLGRGDPVILATALHDGLALSGTPLGSAAPPPRGAASAPAIDLDTGMIDRTLGAKGMVVSGVYQVSIPRAETIRDGNMDVPTAMGSAEAINFQPTGDGTAAITGDFVLTASEVNPVLRALGEHGIEVTALHNHMLNDEPRLFFMHFWAHDDAAKLANGLRDALDKVNVSRG